jgi:GNAT superfamily N-acetyltransferase
LRLVFEPLGKTHDRRSFRSGSAAIDDWLARRAGQDVRRDVARVFVAVDAEAPSRILGFYSLGAFSVTLDDLPAALARKLPRYEAIPAALVGRLARHEAARGTGMGTRLLVNALRRVLAVADTMAVFAIVVDAKDERAAAFYRPFGFQPFAGHPGRLFIAAATAQAAVHAADR